MNQAIDMINAAHDPIAALLGEWSVDLGAGSVALRIALSVVLRRLSAAKDRVNATLRDFAPSSF